MTSAGDFRIRLRVREALNALDDARKASGDQKTASRLRSVTQALEEILAGLTPEPLLPDQVHRRFQHLRR
jgi:hypothetical protein